MPPDGECQVPLPCRAHSGAQGVLAAPPPFSQAPVPRLRLQAWEAGSAVGRIAGRKKLLGFWSVTYFFFKGKCSELDKRLSGGGGMSWENLSVPPPPAPQEGKP